jgi:hypothetical protein
MRTALIILAALPLLAAAGSSANFSGHVFVANGTTQIAGAIVTVTTPSGYISSVTTDKTGEFSFNTLPAGEYDFRVTAHGFAIFERQITVSVDGGVRQLDIRMLVPASKQTVSVADLRRLDVTRAGATQVEFTHRGL